MNNKVLLGLLVTTVLSGVALFNTDKVKLGSNQFTDNIIIENNVLKGQFRNQNIQDSDLKKVANAISDSIFWSRFHDYEVSHFDVDLSENQITNPCDIIIGIQESAGDFSINLNFSSNQISVPKCMDQIYGPYIGFDFSNNNIQQEGYEEFKKLEYSYYRPQFSLNLSNNGPIPSGTFSFLNSYKTLRKLSLYLDNVQIQPDFLSDVQIKTVTLNLSLKNNGLSSFGNLAEHTSCSYLNIDAANNDFSDDSDFDSLKSINRIYGVSLNLYENNQMSQSFVNQLQHQSRNPVYSVNLESPDYHFLFESD